MIGLGVHTYQITWVKARGFSWWVSPRPLSLIQQVEPGNSEVIYTSQLL